MAFVKGQSGNPKGRPKKGESHMCHLEKALQKISEEKKKPFWEHVLEQAYSDNKVLIALMHKLVPNLEKSDLTHNLDQVRLLITRGSSSG